MSNELLYLKSNLNPFRLLKTYPLKEWIVCPFHGIHIFEGVQGSGKTLSLIRFVKAMLVDFPGLTVLSNVAIGDIDYIEWNTPQDLIDFIRRQNMRGCIVICDEINVVFPSTDKPSREFMEIVCMLRHFEIYFIGTCQVFNRCSKPLREQTKYITNTKIPFKGFSLNRTYTIDYEMMLMAEDSGDVKSALKHIDTQFYFHHIDDYNRYDSHATIKLLDYE